MYDELRVQGCTGQFIKNPCLDFRPGDQCCVKAAWGVQGLATVWSSGGAGVGNSVVLWWSKCWQQCSPLVVQMLETVWHSGLAPACVPQCHYSPQALTDIFRFIWYSRVKVNYR